jgi:hypothetical protein
MNRTGDINGNYSSPSSKINFAYDTSRTSLGTTKGSGDHINANYLTSNRNKAVGIGSMASKANLPPVSRVGADFDEYFPNEFVFLPLTF